MSPKSTVKLHTGREMPVIGLGTWQLTHDTPGTVVKALEFGYRMIDTSGDYGTQPGIGQGIKQSGVNRDDFYLVTKVEETDDAYEATRKNLDELGLEYADLMLIHRPPSEGVGEDLWDGLIRAKRDGLTKDIGVSNYSPELMQTLMERSDEMPVVNQIEWSPFGYNSEMYDFALENGIIIQAYSPLTRTQRLGEESLLQIAMKYNKSPAQILLRWSIQRGTVPLPKANQVGHLRENIDIFDFEINDDDMTKLDGMNEFYSSLGTLAYM